MTKKNEHFNVFVKYNMGCKKNSHNWENVAIPTAEYN